MKQISVTLTTKGLEKAVKELGTYKSELLLKAKALVSKMSTLGVEIAKVNIENLNAIDTGKLLNSVSSYYDEETNTGFVRVNNEYCAFVEFGTGIVGKGTYVEPTVLAKASWNYATGEHIFTTKDGKIGWIYYNDKINQFVFTEGMTARPYMYNTATYLRQNYSSIAREVFK